MIQSPTTFRPQNTTINRSAGSPFPQSDAPSEPKDSLYPADKNCWVPPTMGSAPAAEIAPATAAEVDSAVAASNAFTFDLHQRMAEAEGGNQFISPFNLNTCMAMVYAGAGSETAEGIAGALKLEGLEGDRVAAAVGQLSGGAAVQSDGVKLSISNRLFSEQTYPVKDSFKAVTRDQFGAEATSLNIQGDPDGSRQTINKMVSDDTNERIPELFPEGAIKSNSVVVLTSALHFDGKWDKKFPEDNNIENFPFKAEGGAETTKTMMYQNGDFRSAQLSYDGEYAYGWDAKPDVQVLEMDYQGGRFTRVVLLPGEQSSLKELESKLTAENVANWTSKVHEGECDVYYPQTEVKNDFSMKDVLSEMGAAQAFETGADFSNLGPGKLKVDEVFHSTFLKDGNDGTEAAAASGAVIGLESMRSVTEIKCDRPFMTLIRDNETGAIIGTTRVTE